MDAPEAVLTLVERFAFHLDAYRVYGLFIELSLLSLLRQGGIVSFIVPPTLLSKEVGRYAPLPR